MKHKIVFLLAAIGLLFYSSAAQNATGKINGFVKDAQNSPLAGATISLLNSKDSAIVKTVLAGDDGKFIFKNIRGGVYLVTAGSIGYNKYTSSLLAIDNDHMTVQLPVIVLQLTGRHNLQEVVVTAKKPLIERKIDRTIINVDAMITAAGSNTLEVLAKSPGVTVDINGDISLYGKGGVLVLIDDKPTYMSVQDLAAYLRSIPGSLLDKIELMSSPPAKYDASGSAVINIELKKNRAAGFNGNFSAGYSQGVYARSNAALNINYRNKKLNFFGNFSYSGDKNYSADSYSRYFYNTDGSPASTVLMNSRYTYTSNGWNARAGADYFISRNTTLGILFTGNLRPKTDRLSYNSNQYDGGMKLDSVGTGYTNGTYHWKGSGINLNMQHKFDTTGTILSTDLDYINYHSDGNQLSPNQVYLPDGSISSSNSMMYQLPSGINIYSFKADFSHPINGKARFDAGLKSSYVTTDNSTNWFNGTGGGFIPDYSKSNHFIYRENINALYINATKDWTRWSVQAGVRMENTQSNGHQLGNIAVTDSSFTKSYTDIFPSLYLLYKLDKKGDNTLRVTYQKRIRRPNYQQLNPFLAYRDKYSYSAGNPYLNPHYNNFVELEYSYKQHFGVTFLYGHINNLIQSLTQVLGDTFITRPQNFGLNYSFNIRPYVTVSPVKGWDLNAMALVFYLVNKGDAYGQIIDNKVVTGELEMNNQFSFGHGWSGEFSGGYGTRHKGGQSIIGAGWGTSAGLQKTILQNKGTLRLKMDNIFYSRFHHETIIGLYQASAFHSSESDARRVGLSFSYRFGKDANARKRNHNSDGAADEQGRVN